MTPPLTDNSRGFLLPSPDPANPDTTLRPGPRRRYLNSPPSPAIELARACSTALRAAERTETTSLLALAAVVAAGLLLSASILEHCLAGWPRFEALVRAALG